MVRSVWLQVGEMDTTREAHAAYYLALAEEATQGFKGRQQAEWLERTRGRA